MVRQVILGALLLLFTGCQQYQSCGKFTFSPMPDPPSNFGPTAVRVNVGFDFDPAQCKPPVAVCQCDRIVYLQMIRISDPDVSKNPYKANFFIFPDDQYFVRQTDAGWSLDVTAGRALGYYGLTDDGTPVIVDGNPIVIPGQNGASAITAVLHDKPTISDTVWGPNLPNGDSHSTLFEAVDAPVCVQGDGMCLNKTLGYLYWRIRADKQRNILEAAARFADDDYTVSLQQAIASWNAHVGSQKQPLPAFSLLR
jgi:hypothetical protein